MALLAIGKVRIPTTVGLYWGFKELIPVLRYSARSQAQGNITHSGVGGSEGGGAVTTGARAAATVSAQ